MKRYGQDEVVTALEHSLRGRFTPHDQLVLAGEVVALREQSLAAMVCPEHAILMYIAPGSSKHQCWHCNEGRRLREANAVLQQAVRGATDCPESRNGPDGRWRCWYRAHQEARTAVLEADNARLRAIVGTQLARKTPPPIPPLPRAKGR